MCAYISDLTEGTVPPSRRTDFKSLSKPQSKHLLFNFQNEYPERKFELAYATLLVIMVRQERNDGIAEFFVSRAKNPSLVSSPQRPPLQVLFIKRLSNFSFVVLQRLNRVIPPFPYLPNHLFHPVLSVQSLM